jgi:hypothetical protein
MGSERFDFNEVEDEWRGDPEEGGGRPEGAAAPLPCLNSHSSNEEEGEDWLQESGQEEDPEGVKDKWNVLQGSQRKTAFCLQENVQAMVKLFGVDHVLFLTHTLPDEPWTRDHKEVSRRWNSYRTGWMRARVDEYILVPERHQDGRIHYHLIIAVPWSVGQATFDHAAVDRRDYRTANPELKAFWKDQREACARYGLGRPQSTPVKTTGKQIGVYVGKYIGKNVEGRLLADVGARLVRYSKGLKKRIDFLTANAFAWNSKRALLFRGKLKKVASKCGITEPEHFKEHFGRTWAFTAQKRIVSEPFGEVNEGGELVTTYPSWKHAQADGKDMHAFSDYDLPTGQVTISEQRTHEYWEENLDGWLLEMKKAISFADIKRNRGMTYDD